MKNVTAFVIFACGVSVGAVSSWFYAKKKYQKLAQEEIDSVKQVFSWKKEESDYVKNDQEETEKIAAEFNREKPSIADYAKKLSEEGYTRYSNSEIGQKDEDDEDKPYVISPDEFGEKDGYTQISLSFFSDHKLTDENYEPIEDIENTVGVESLNCFGEYEDDSVFVRNDRLKADFAILLDQRRWSDVAENDPLLRGGLNDEESID